MPIVTTWTELLVRGLRWLDADITWAEATFTWDSIALTDWSTEL